MILRLPQCATAAQDFANAGQTMHLQTLTTGRGAEQRPWPDELRLELLHPAGGSMQLNLHANLQQIGVQHLHQNLLQYRHFLRQIWQNRPLQEVQQQLQLLRQEWQQRQPSQPAHQQPAKPQQLGPSPGQVSMSHNTARLVNTPLASNYAPPASKWGQTLPALQATWRIITSALSKMPLAPAGMPSVRSLAMPLQFTFGGVNTMMLATLQQHLASKPFGLINNAEQVARLTQIGPNGLTSMPVEEIHTSPFYAWPGLRLQMVQIRSDVLNKKGTNERTKESNKQLTKQRNEHLSEQINKQTIKQQVMQLAKQAKQPTSFASTEFTFSRVTHRDQRTLHQTIAHTQNRAQNRVPTHVPNQVLQQGVNQVTNQVANQALNRTSTQILKQILNQTSNQFTTSKDMKALNMYLARAHNQNNLFLFPDLLQKFQAIQSKAYAGRSLEKNQAQLGATLAKLSTQREVPSFAAKQMLLQSLAETADMKFPPAAMLKNTSLSLASFTFLQYPKLAYAFAQAKQLQTKQRPPRKQTVASLATLSYNEVSAAQHITQRVASVMLAHLHRQSAHSIATIAGITARPAAALSISRQYLPVRVGMTSATDLLTRVPSLQISHRQLHNALYATLQTTLHANLQPAHKHWLSTTLNYRLLGKPQQQTLENSQQKMLQLGLQAALQPIQQPRKEVGERKRAVSFATARIARLQPRLRALALLSAQASLQGSSTPIAPPSMQIALHVHQPVAQLRRYGQPMVAREFRQAGLSAPKAQRLQQQLQQQLQTQLQSVERQVHTQIVQEIVQVGTSRDHLRKLMNETMLAPNLLQTLVARVATALERRASLERYRRG